jgi:hypothetical protein
MNIDQVVVIGILIVVIMAVFVSVVELATPIIKRLEFNSICRNYTLIAESENGLSDEMRQKLEITLKNSGYESVMILSAKNDGVMRGNQSVLTVEVTYKTSKLINLFNKVDETILFRYEQGFIARKIVM